MIGRMKEYITVQTKSTTSDGQGGATVSWATLASEWAEATMLSQSRTLSEAGVKFRTAVRFRMRYCADHILTTDHQIVWDGNTYTIHSVVKNSDILDVLTYR